MGKVSCQACNRSCKGQAIRLNDRYYHVKCFKCKECSKPLATGGFYTKDDAHYCVEDYQRLFGTRCHACGLFVEGEVVTALGNTYHETCFHCTGCQKRFMSGDKVTCVGKDYLCNVCLERNGSGSPTDDEPRTKKALHVPRGSASAPTTPAKQDFIGGGSESGMTDGHLSSPTLDISVDSIPAITCDPPSVNEANTESYLSPFATNTSGYKSDVSFESPNHRDNLSPIHSIMRYRSVSPWSAMSHSYQRSKASEGSSGRLSRFDSDFGKFYNMSYLDKETNFRRGPSQNTLSQSREKSPRHYHRPENFSYLQGRRDVLKSSKKGDRSYTDSLKQFERYRPDKAQEPIKLSRIPDAHKDDSYIAPIERDDFPAPPAPAAAYPELLRRSNVMLHKSSDRLSRASDTEDKENINGGGVEDDEAEDNGVALDSKTVREMEELAKMKDSGAARVILEDMKKKQHEKHLVVLDPRSASRTPSASTEPHYRPRYDSPLFASPSRDTDMRLRLRSTESLIERKYRTSALPFGNVPVLKPGYTQNVRPSTNNANRYSCDGLDVIQPPQRPVSCVVDFSRNVYSSQSSINEIDPTTGLRRYARPRSCTISDGAMSPYFGLRRSVPSLFRTEEPCRIYAYEHLRKMLADGKVTPDIDKDHCERHLAPTEFESLFGMTYEEFYRLAEWRRNDLKSRVGLF